MAADQTARQAVPKGVTDDGHEPEVGSVLDMALQQLLSHFPQGN